MTRQARSLPATPDFFFFGAFAKLKNRLLASSSPSGWNNWAPTGRIFMKFDIWVLFDNLSRKFQFHCNRKRIKGILHEDQYTFSIKSRSVLLRMNNPSDASSRETRNTRFIFNDFFFKSCRLWVKNVVQRGRPQMTIRNACWIPKATNTQVM